MTDELQALMEKLAQTEAMLKAERVEKEEITVTYQVLYTMSLCFALPRNPFCILKRRFVKSVECWVL